jgi:hypothetical protein
MNNKRPPLSSSANRRAIGNWQALVCVLFACRCSPSNADSTTVTVTSAQACAESATDYCGHLMTCAPYFLSTSYGTLADCVASVEHLCGLLLKAPGTGLTPAQLLNCAKANANASCADVTAIDYQFASCKVKGSLNVGAACGDDSQCSSGYCKLDYYQVCGTCVERRTAGASCTRSEDCQLGLGCVTPGNCAPLPGLGASCATTPCAGRLACIGDVCGQPLIKGAACDPQSDNCDLRLGLYCNPSNNTCIEQTLIALGASCTAAFTTCMASASCNGVCAAPLADGSACTLSDNCAYPAQCVSGTCVPPDPAQCK